jgi:hypothetical protein
MDRHQRICKSRPHQQEAAPPAAAAASLQQSTAEVHIPAMLSISNQPPLGPNLSDQLQQQQQQNSVDTGSHHHYNHHHHLQLLVPGNNHNIMESEGLNMTSTLMIPSGHVLDVDSSPSLF